MVQQKKRFVLTLAALTAILTCIITLSIYSTFYPYWGSNLLGWSNISPEGDLSAQRIYKTNDGLRIINLQEEEKRIELYSVNEDQDTELLSRSTVDEDHFSGLLNVIDREHLSYLDDENQLYYFPERSFSLFIVDFNNNKVDQIDLGMYQPINLITNSSFAHVAFQDLGNELDVYLLGEIFEDVPKGCIYKDECSALKVFRINKESKTVEKEQVLIDHLPGGFTLSPNRCNVSENRYGPCEDQFGRLFTTIEGISTYRTDRQTVIDILYQYNLESSPFTFTFGSDNYSAYDHQLRYNQEVGHYVYSLAIDPSYNIIVEPDGHAPHPGDLGLSNFSSRDGVLLREESRTVTATSLKGTGNFIHSSGEDVVITITDKASQTQSILLSDLLEERISTLSNGDFLNIQNMQIEPVSEDTFLLVVESVNERETSTKKQETIRAVIVSNSLEVLSDYRISAENISQYLVFENKLYVFKTHENKLFLKIFTLENV